MTRLATWATPPPCDPGLGESCRLTDWAPMLPHTGRRQPGPPEIRNLRGGDPRSRGYTRSRHEISPFRPVRSHTLAVNEMHRSVGSFVTQDLFQQVCWPVDQPGGQTDLSATGAVAPKGSPESRARSEGDLAAQPGHSPELRPMRERVPKCLYALRIQSRFRPSSAWVVAWLANSNHPAC